MKKILIIGCGFAGLSAAIKLSSHQQRVGVTVIDKRDNFTFLPLLPDIIGREVSARHIIYPIEKLSQRFGFRFIKDKAQRISLDENKVFAENGHFEYDYLIVAAGSETNFYGNKQIEYNAFKLDDAEDGNKIHQAVLSDKYNTFIVSGGGYTGIEVATNLKLIIDKKKLSKKVIVVEAAKSLLGPLANWMKEYVMKNLGKMEIEYKLETSIKQVDEKNVLLSNGQQFSKAVLIWSAGVKTPEVVHNLGPDKTKQGRLKVDEYLRVRENCFVAGDCAAFSDLRMAARFAIQQGRVAADNIVSSINGKGLRKYRPFDWGYLVPMANNRACGIVLGRGAKGFLPILAHYFLCVWLSYGTGSRIGVIKDILKSL